MHNTRIVIVDDHRILLDALKTLVEPEFEVVATFEDANSLLESVLELQPDIIVLDIGMPGMDGLTAGTRLKKMLPNVKLVFLTASPDRDCAAEAFKLGASGYLLKNSAGSELKKALREVIRGGYFASESLTDGMIGSFVHAFKHMEVRQKLTARQREVLWLFSEGNSMKEIASVLSITPRTVAFHKYSIMEQNDIKSNAELISFALTHLPPIH
jgi:DNA-binding NarL/FixJ family response regulator